MAERLEHDEELAVEQELLATSGNCRVVLQRDGDLVLQRISAVDGTWERLWHSRTSGQDARRCIMQRDGNLVIYDSRSRPLWESETSGTSARHCIVQDDENFVVYRADGHPVWATDTFNPSPFAPGPNDVLKKALEEHRASLAGIDMELASASTGDDRRPALPRERASLVLTIQRLTHIIARKR